MDRLLSMRVFQQVIDTGGFAAAARALDLSPASVTRLVTDLETHLGARLIQRTTRKISLTEAGSLYLVRVRNIMHEIEDAEASASANVRELTGTLHVLSSPVLATYLLAPSIAAWCTRHPRLSLDVAIDPQPHLRVDEYDATLMTMGDGYNGNVVARLLLNTELGVYASPEFLRRLGVPLREPQDLQNLPLLRYQQYLVTPSAPRLRLQSTSGSGDTVEVSMNAVLDTMSMDLQLRATLDGVGVGVLSKLLTQTFVASGHLVHLLPDWTLGQFSIYLALPSRKLIPARTRAFLEFVTEVAQNGRRPGPV